MTVGHHDGAFVRVRLVIVGGVDSEPWPAPRAAKH